MKLIVGGRGFGKTTYLIEESATTGNVIVCKDNQDRDRIIASAKKLNYEIPRPFTYGEIVNQRHRGRDFSGFLIDEIETFVLYVVNSRIAASTYTPNEKIIDLPIPKLANAKR